jgi:hypothetical protein
LLAAAVDIHRWLESDQATPMQVRSQRDRDLGRQQPALDDASRLLNWWAQVEPKPAQPASVGQRLIKMRSWISAGLFAIGLFLGLTLCSLALTYRGDYPVNLLAMLGVLVGIPGLMLLLTFLSGALQGVGSRYVSGLVNGLNINRWILGLWDRLSSDQFSTSFGQGDARRRFAFWQVVTFSQVFSVGFFAGVLCMFGLLVAVTDLAFGWSTTLEVQVTTVHQWVIVVAYPWAGLWPAAVPDADLVEISRFYRLAGVVADEHAARLGQWWRFVLMVIVVWGLIPRLILWSFGSWRLHLACRCLLLEHAQVTALLDRLKTPSLGREGNQQVPDAITAEAVPQTAPIQVSNAAVIVWNEAKTLETINGQLGSVVVLNTLQSEQQRRHALTNVAPGAEKLIVYTKGWEPPLLEFNDLLELIREVAGEQLRIVVSPMGLAGQSLTDSDQAIWSAAVGKFGDPRVYLSDASDASDVPDSPEGGGG